MWEIWVKIWVYVPPILGGENKQMFDMFEVSPPINIYLEPKWPLFWLEKALFLEGLTFKNRGQLGL